jgi:Mn-dependent DtxR family transcriptional regulator
MDLSPTQEGIIRHLFLRGDDVPANIGEAEDFHRNSISRACSELSEAGLIESKGHGVWTLTNAGERAARRLLNEG